MGGDACSPKGETVRREAARHSGASEYRQVALTFEPMNLGDDKGVAPSRIAIAKGSGRRGHRLSLTGRSYVTLIM